jgi:hypothetical protein
VDNPDEKGRYVQVIADCPHDEIRFSPFGSGWGRSPMNPDAWKTPADKPIWTRQLLSSRACLGDLSAVQVVILFLALRSLVVGNGTAALLRFLRDRDRTRLQSFDGTRETQRPSAVGIRDVLIGVFRRFGPDG